MSKKTEKLRPYFYVTELSFCIFCKIKSVHDFTVLLMLNSSLKNAVSIYVKPTNCMHECVRNSFAKFSNMLYALLFSILPL